MSFIELCSARTPARRICRSQRPGFVAKEASKIVRRGHAKGASAAGFLAIALRAERSSASTGPGGWCCRPTMSSVNTRHPTG